MNGYCHVCQKDNGGIVCGDCMDYVDKLKSANKNLLKALKEIDSQLSGTHLYENGWIGKESTPSSIVSAAIERAKGGTGDE